MLLSLHPPPAREGSKDRGDCLYSKDPRHLSKTVIDFITTSTKEGVWHDENTATLMLTS